jgi:hypothetical protein
VRLSALDFGDLVSLQFPFKSFPIFIQRFFIAWQRYDGAEVFVNACGDFDSDFGGVGFYFGGDSEVSVSGGIGVGAVREDWDS